MNLALLDVMSAALASYDPGEVTSKKADVAAGFFRLMEDNDFISAITYGTNGVRQVRARFEKALAMFEEATEVTSPIPSNRSRRDAHGYAP